MSNQPYSHKKATVYNLVGEVVKLFHQTYHKYNIYEIVNILLQIFYPLHFLQVYKN